MNKGEVSLLQSRKYSSPLVEKRNVLFHQFVLCYPDQAMHIL